LIKEEDKRDYYAVPIINEKLETEKRSTLSSKEQNMEVEDHGGEIKVMFRQNGIIPFIKATMMIHQAMMIQNKGSLGSAGSGQIIT
jgi:hypothetical protein